MENSLLSPSPLAGEEGEEKHNLSAPTLVLPR
jgi:hypothetical protein